MSDFPAELKYADSHEWARLEDDGTVVVGITNHAQEALGDIVYIELPEIGAETDAGAEIAVVESVKAASDIYSPVCGEVVALNEELEDSPETVNQSPYGDGWLFRVKVEDPEQLDSLMTADAYQAMVDEG